MDSQKSMVGTSGGPILGFYNDNGQQKYLIVAIQSSWREKSKIVYGCPILVFMEVIGDAIKKNWSTETS